MLIDQSSQRKDEPSRGKSDVIVKKILPLVNKPIVILVVGIVLLKFFLFQPLVDKTAEGIAKWGTGRCKFKQHKK